MQASHRVEVLLDREGAQIGAIIVRIEERVGEGSCRNIEDRPGLPVRSSSTLLSIRKVSVLPVENDAVATALPETSCAQLIVARETPPGRAIRAAVHDSPWGAASAGAGSGLTALR